MINPNTLARVRRLVRQIAKVGTSLDVMYENADIDSVTGKRIHNLTITWTEPEENDD